MRWSDIRGWGSGRTGAIVEVSWGEKEELWVQPWNWSVGMDLCRSGE